VTGVIDERNVGTIRDASVIFTSMDDNALTKEERARYHARVILLSLMAGVTTDQLSRMYFIRPVSLNNVISRACERYGVTGRLALLAYLVRIGDVTGVMFTEWFLNDLREYVASRTGS